MYNIFVAHYKKSLITLINFKSRKQSVLLPGRVCQWSISCYTSCLP